MERNFNRPFLDYKGNPIQSALIADEVCKILFNVGTGNSDKSTLDEKFMAYKLCTRIMQSPETVELSVDEAAYIDKTCGERLTAGAYGQLRSLLNNE